MNKHYLKIAAGALLLSVSSALFSQNVAINTTGNAAYLSAILDLSNNNTTGLVGFLPPYVSLTSATTFGLNGTAAQSSGIIVYNTNVSTSLGLSGPGLYFWNNTLSPASWVYLGSGLSGTGQTNYLARWTSPTSLNVGASQDGGTAAGVSQSAINFVPLTSLFTVIAPVTQYINAVLGTAQVTGGIGVIGGNSASTATNAGVEGYIGTAGIPANAAVAVYGLANTSTGNQVGVEGFVTGAASNNYGSYFSASGATRNYAIIVPSGGGNVGLGITAPSASAILDLTNTNATGGTAAALVWPENANPTANVTPPSEGEEIYNSTTGCFQFYHSGAWQSAGCPCTVAPTAATPVPSCTKPFGGETVTYSVTTIGGASYNWSATSNNGTPTVTGGGTATVTVTWPTYASTGTVTSSLSNFCGTTNSSFTTTITPDSMTGPSSVFSIANAGRYYVAAGNSYAWTVTAGGGTLAPASNYVDLSNPTTNFTIQCVVTGAGTCTATLTMPVTVSACTGAISQDPNPLSYSTNSWTYTSRGFGGGRYTTNGGMTITTTDNNDLVVVALTDRDGGGFFRANGITPTGGSVSYQFNGGGAVAATQYQSVSTFYTQGTSNIGAAPIDIFYFTAALAGTYSISVNEPNFYNNNEEIDFAMALTGSCTTASILGYTYGNYLCSTCYYYGVQTTLAPFATAGTYPIGTYALGVFNNIYLSPDGTQTIQFSQGYTTIINPPQMTNYGLPGVTYCTASMGGHAFTAAVTIPGGAANIEMLAQDGNYIGTAEAVGLFIH